MKNQLRFTGVGGQGILLAGDILAAAKIKDGGYGVKAATYTSQVRGGPTKTDVVLDDKDILFPYAIDGEIEFMLSTANISFNLFKNGIKGGSKIVVDPNLVTPSQYDEDRWKIYHIPIISIAKEEVGNVVTQSIVALAITVLMSNAIDRDVIFELMKTMVPPKTIEINAKAFKIGEKHALKALNEK